MFVRKTKSRNSTCFQIGRKEYGRFVLAKHVGCAKTPAEIEVLKIKAREELIKIVLKNQLSLFEDVKDTPKAKLLNWHITGFHQVFGSVYDLIGFPNSLLRDLSIARIVSPKSKLATMRYLNRYLGMNIGKNALYQVLDSLNKEDLTGIAFSFVSRRKKGISLIFYDVTTLYFETETEDDLRKKGYSKDHRIDTPQILIGLFVDADGYPFDFDVFEGNSFEGHTFQKAVDSLIKRYEFEGLTVVADAGMLSDDNLTFLAKRGIGYIVGARIRNLSQDLTKMIHAHDFTQDHLFQIPLGENKLIVDFSLDRQKKDYSNRERLIRKLKEKLASGQQLIKKSKYLKLQKGRQVLGLNQEKIEYDKFFDGLKGYITNTKDLNVDVIIKEYHNLWRVEKAFRMSKNDLRERPVYHFLHKRIISHLLVCFVSLLVMKEAERILKSKNYSLEKAIEMLGKVGQGEIRVGNVSLEVDSELNQETQLLLELFVGH